MFLEQVINYTFFPNKKCLLSETKTMFSGFCFFKEFIHLQEYNQHIQNLKEEMEEATKHAEQVREEIQSFRNHYMIINSGDACEICNLTLMIRPFYIFPCHHKFHNDCLLTELLPLLGKCCLCF